MRFHDGRGFPSQNRRSRNQARNSPVVLSDHTWCYHLNYLLLNKTTYLDLICMRFHIEHCLWYRKTLFSCFLLQDFWDNGSILCPFLAFVSLIIFERGCMCCSLFLFALVVSIAAVWVPVWCRIWFI